MQSEEWIEIFRSIPEERHATLVMVLTNGSEISVDCLFRFEPTFVILRGRLGGTTDDNRAFFVPYDRIQYVRVDRVIKLEELALLVGEAHTSAGKVCAPELDGKSIIGGAEADPKAAPPPAVAVPTTTPVPGSEEMVRRNALLERIRAARLTTGGNPGK